MYNSSIQLFASPYSAVRQLLCPDLVLFTILIDTLALHEVELINAFDFNQDGFPGQLNRFNGKNGLRLLTCTDSEITNNSMLAGGLNTNSETAFLPFA